MSPPNIGFSGYIYLPHISIQKWTKRLDPVGALEVGGGLVVARAGLGGGEGGRGGASQHQWGTPSTILAHITAVMINGEIQGATSSAQQ